jgi:hypothetical protein
MIVDLQDEPWGQRHFLLSDPTGTLLDVVQQIPPSLEYAPAYADAPSRTDSNFTQKDSTVSATSRGPT